MDGSFDKKEKLNSHAKNSAAVSFIEVFEAVRYRYKNRPRQIMTGSNAGSISG